MLLLLYEWCVIRHSVLFMLPSEYLATKIYPKATCSRLDANTIHRTPMTSGWLFQVRSARRCMLCFPVEESGWGCFSITPVWLICSCLSICASSMHFVLPSAGWQRHRVERDALIVGSPHGSRLSHRACLQSSSGGIEGIMFLEISLRSESFQNLWCQF